MSIQRSRVNYSTWRRNLTHSFLKLEAKACDLRPSSTSVKNTNQKTLLKVPRHNVDSTALLTNSQARGSSRQV